MLKKTVELLDMPIRREKRSMNTNKPALGSSLDEILSAFKNLSDELSGLKIVEAAIIGSPLRFRWQGHGRLGVVVGEIGIRDASMAEYAELEEAIELGQAQVYKTPLYVHSRVMKQDVLHLATGSPLDPNSPAARKQQERYAQAYPPA